MAEPRRSWLRRSSAGRWVLARPPREIAPPPPVPVQAPPIQERQHTETPQRPATARPAAGVVLRSLTEEEREARSRALSGAREREEEERRIALAEAQAREQRESREREERAAAAERKREEEARRAHEAEAKRRSEQEAKRTARTWRTAAAAGFSRREKAAWCIHRAHRQRAPAAGRRGGNEAGHSPPRHGAEGGAAAPDSTRRAEEPRPPYGGQRHGGGGRADPFGRRFPPAHATAERPCRRAEGKALARGHPARDDHHPGTRQPHVRARRRRHQASDEAGRDGKDHRRDRR